MKYASEYNEWKSALLAKNKRVYCCYRFDETCLDTENFNYCQIIFDGSFLPFLLTMLTICERSKCGRIQKICVGHDSGCGIVWFTKINGTVTS